MVLVNLKLRAKPLKEGNHRTQMHIKREVQARTSTIRTRTRFSQSMEAMRKPTWQQTQ
jgi:hypothetical protein